MSINSVPIGLLEFLQNKIDGRNPVDLLPNVQGVLGLDRWYETGFAWQYQNFTDVPSPGAPGPIVMRTFVSEQLLLIRNIHVFCDTAAATTERFRAAVFRFDGAGVPRIVGLADPSPFGTSAANTASSSSYPRAWNQAIVLRAGVQYALGCFCEQSGGAGVATYHGGFEFANLTNQ